MNTHNQFTSSKERIHLLLVLFLSIIFCSCTKEDSPVSIEATSKVVTTSILSMQNYLRLLK